MKVHHSFNGFRDEDINFLTNLHRNLYDAGIASDDSLMSRGLILQFKKQIFFCDKVEFITELFNCNFYSYYTLKLLFSLPELWLDFKLADWITIVSNIKRIVPRPLGMYEGCFCDIVFLCCYIGIDSFQIIMSSNFDKEAKKNILSYFRMHPSLLQPSSENIFLFQNVEENIFSLLKTYKDKFLLINPSINTFESENILDKIKVMWKTLN